jgi:RecA/RadA recombinase
MELKEVIAECLERIDRARAGDRMISGLPTGFLDLDKLTTGFHPGEFVVVAGRTGVGKSGFMLSVAVNYSTPLGDGASCFTEGIALSTGLTSGRSNPTKYRFIDAFTSLSWVVPHTGQIQVLSCKAKSSFL